MTDFVVSTYNEEFLEKQIGLVNESTKNWEQFIYPDLEQLKETYARDGFDPETRHYIFENDDLVGFIASAMENKTDDVQFGSIQYPFVKPGYERLREKLLMKASNGLKEKGVDVIRTRFHESWGDYKSIIELGKFESKGIGNSFVILKTNEYDFSDFKNDDIHELDIDKDKKELARVFKSEMPQTLAQIEGIIENWKEATQIVSNLIIKNGDEIVSHAMVLNNQQDTTQGGMGHVSIYDDKYTMRRPDVFKQIIVNAKKAGIESITLNMGPIDNPESYYTEFDLKFERIHSYEYDLR